MWEPQLKAVYEDLLDSHVRITQKPQYLGMSLHFDLIVFARASTRAWLAKEANPKKALEKLTKSRVGICQVVSVNLRSS